jgi:hypothetical protein
MDRLKRFLSASLCTILLSYLILAIAIRNDLLANAALYDPTSVFKLGLVLAAINGILAASLSKHLPAWGSILIAMLTAGIFGYLVPRLGFHHFIGAWRWSTLEPGSEIQTTLCWIAATVSGLLIAFGRRVPALIATVVLSAIAIAVPAPAYRYLMHDQELTVAFVLPGPSLPNSPSPRILNGSDNTINTAQLISDVRALLKRSGINDEYHLTFASRVGRGKRALQVIVIDRQVTSRAKLPEPKAAEVLYIQKGDAWERIPPDAPVLDRALRLSRHNEHTDFWIPDARGVSLGGRIEPD